MKEIKNLAECVTPSRPHAKITMIRVIFDYNFLAMTNGSRVLVNELLIMSQAIGCHAILMVRLTIIFFPMTCLLIPLFSLIVNTFFSSSAKTVRNISQSTANLSIHSEAREFFLPFVNF